jgi:hypothetical protein
MSTLQQRDGQHAGLRRAPGKLPVEGDEALAIAALVCMQRVGEAQARLLAAKRSVSRSRKLALAALQSITWSARSFRPCGSAMPSPRAALSLRISLNSRGCSIAISAGFSPLRMRATYSPARRNTSSKSGP